MKSKLTASGNGVPDPKKKSTPPKPANKPTKK